MLAVWSQDVLTLLAANDEGTYKIQHERELTAESSGVLLAAAGKNLLVVHGDGRPRDSMVIRPRIL